MLPIVIFNPSDFSRFIIIFLYSFIPAMMNFTPLLFGLFGLVAEVGFRRINDGIQALVDKDETNGLIDPRCLDKWQFQHTLLFDYVALYNQMFCIPLTAEFFHIFLRLITCFYFIMISNPEIPFKEWSYLVLSIDYIISLLIICSTAHRIKKEVSLVLFLWKL